MLHANCQVCGGSMYSPGYFGTDLDGSLNPEYCSGCYRGGQFYSRDWNGSLSGQSMPWAMMFSGENLTGRGYGV